MKLILLLLCEEASKFGNYIPDMEQRIEFLKYEYLNGVYVNNTE